ncbi:MAG: hypothetical protein HC938_14040 [Nitrospira sp.]|nr:hypothetical protein [Nitrospira sp.]
MTQSSRVLIVLILSSFLIWSMGRRSEASDAHEKESASEKPISSGASQPSVASDGQPTSPKPAPETKPQLPVAPAPKSDASTEHKEVAPEKPGTGSSQAPAGSDSQSTTPKPAGGSKPSPAATPSPTPKGEASTEHKEGAPESLELTVSRLRHRNGTGSKAQSPGSSRHRTSDASAEHKEGASKKSTTDSQPTIPKPTPEAKPQPSTSPVMKVDLPPDREIKDKEPALKKTLGSLILSVKLALLGDFKFVPLRDRSGR